MIFLFNERLSIDTSSMNSSFVDALFKNASSIHTPSNDAFMTRDIARLIILLVLYSVFFIPSAIVLLMGDKSKYKWVPAIFKREICLRPLYLVTILLPAIFWPVIVAVFAVGAVGVSLAASVVGLCYLLFLTGKTILS